MDERTQKIIGAILGIGLIAAILWYLFFRNKGKLDTSNMIAPKDGSSKPTSSGSQTTTTTYQPTQQSGASDPNMVGYTEIKALQSYLNSTWAGGVVGGIALQKLDVDGGLGPLTAGFIKVIAPNIGAAVINRGFKLSRSEYDILMKYRPTPTVVVNGPQDVSIAGINATNEKSVYMQIIQSKVANSLKTSLSNWTTSGLKEWVSALQAGKAEFYCSSCWYKGYYSCYSGLKIR